LEARLESLQGQSGKKWASPNQWLTHYKVRPWQKDVEF
jgi:hypothetical protein